MTYWLAVRIQPDSGPLPSVERVKDALVNSTALEALAETLRAEIVVENVSDAAPDLLAACEAAELAFSAISTSPIREMLDAAITKARGE